MLFRSSEFNKPAVLVLPDGTKIQLTVGTPKYFNANPLGFPEFGKYPDDRAVHFTVTVKNTAAAVVSVKDMKIAGKTTNAKAPICRDLLGGDGVIDLFGAVDEDGNSLDSLAPGKSASFDWGVVCETPKGKTLSLEVGVGTAKPKIYDTTMP